MPATTRRSARRIRALATITLSAGIALLSTATVAGASLPGGSKNCVHINGCSASVISPPLAATGGPAPPASRTSVAVATAPRSAAQARRASGTLITNSEGARRIRCGGYQFKGPTTLQFQLQATAPTTSTSTTGTGVFRVKLYITYEITERITNVAADGIQFCLGADFAFKTLSGRTAPTRRLPDGTRGHVGLLPPCPTPLPPLGMTKRPCAAPVTTVKNANSTTGVDVILKARVPTLVGAATVRGSGDSASGDPWGGG